MYRLMDHLSQKATSTKAYEAALPPHPSGVPLPEKYSNPCQFR